MSQVRVRFAPSPTGLLHIGGARTALFNWIFARRMGGTFVLRIEDTDAARNSKEAVDIIFKGLQWLGLNWDEGPMPDGSIKGDHGPYFQSQRNEIYKKYVQRLLAEGKAYEFEGAIKFRTPKTIVTVPDLICGNVQFDRTNDPDLVIQRKDGSPVFHLVNVVDDLEMKITHVIRGEDHLSNTPKHLALFEAFGATPPLYGHIPLILNTNGSKMSKRDEGASIGEYIEQGYIPEALRNYLCLLGWSPKDNREVISIEEVIQIFELSQINRSNARFGLDKLFWMNGEYTRDLSIEAYAPLAQSILEKSGISFTGVSQDYFKSALAIVKEKIKVGRELPEWMSYFFTEEFDFDPAAAQKVFTAEGLTHLSNFRAKIAEITSFEFATIENTIKALATENAVKAGVYIHPIRLATSGRPVGPSLYHLLEVLGKERVLSRIDRALAKFKS